MSTEQTQQIIDTGSQKLSAALGSSERYVVPQFQRDYSWGKRECEVLLSDILDLNDSDKSHFLGHVVLSPEDRNLFKLIDGQQRLTTLLLITLVAAMKFKEAAQKGENKRTNNYRVKLCKDRLFTVNVGTLEKLPRITLSYRNDKYFQKLSKQLKITPPTQHQGTNKKIYEVARFFAKEFKDMDCDVLGRMIVNMYESLFVTVIKVNSMLSAFSVFESINSKGSQLQVADLVKNLLMEKIVNGSDNSRFIDGTLSKIDEKWSVILDNVKAREISNYLRSIEMLNSQGKVVTMRKLFMAVRDRVKDEVSAEKYLDELLDYSTAYNVIRGNDNGRWRHNDKNLSSSLKTFFTMKLFNIRLPVSLFMAAADKFERDEFKKFTESILKLTIRYNVVCDYPSRDLEKEYAQMVDKIKSDKMSPDQAIQRLVDTYNPDDQDFHSSFRELTVDKHKAMYFLKEIEEHVEKKKTADLDVDKLISAEGNGHWEDSFDIPSVATIKDSLANYYFKDAESSDLPIRGFDEFKMKNETSPYCINRKIAERTGWDKEAFSAHQRWLATQAVDVWKMEAA